MKTETTKGLARLREQKAAREAEERAQGVAAGREWAKDAADEGQLFKLARETKKHGGDVEAAFTPQSDVATVAEIVEAVMSEGGGSADFFRNDAAVEDDDLTDAFVLGFVEGALEVYRQV